MNRAGLGMPGHFGGRLKSWLHRYRPPFSDWRFWVVQLLVVLVSAVHSTFEMFDILNWIPADARYVYFVPLALLFVPVVYAAVTFGFAGAVATALWATSLAIPNVVVVHSDVAGRLADIFQLGAIVAIAFFVGQRVDREREARQQAEDVSAALTASEVKYRGLFYSSPVAILLLDLAGSIVEANPAAAVLFGGSPDSLKGMNVADLIGAAGAGRLLNYSADDKQRQAPIVVGAKDGSKVYLEPALTRVSDDQSRALIQVLLRDVTEERHRQAGLRVYAAQVLRAQEEERRRMAQELHDETIQELVLLCRQLDSLEGASQPLGPASTEGLQEARATAEKVVMGLRDFARNLRPPTLDDLGVAASIRRLLEDFTERAGANVQLRVVGEERRLLMETEVGLFRIVQEALRNVERHARATEVTVTLDYRADKVRLDVLDNGVGFTLPAGTAEFTHDGQLGLIGMKERAEILGGTLEIDSAPGKGTKVSVSLPAGEGMALPE